MCFGGPDIDTSYQDFAISEADRARQEEAARQARINSGLEHINAVFEGGTYAPIDFAATDAARASATDAATSQWQALVDAFNASRPTTGGGGGRDDRDPTPTPTGPRPANPGTLEDFLAQALSGFQPIVGEAQTYEGMQPVIDQRETAMRDYYLPQLDTERGKASDEMIFALSRAGLLNSTAAGEKTADLNRAYALQRGGILSDIAQDVAGTRTSMAQNRASIEAGLRASGDASLAADQALNSAVTFRSDLPDLNPIGNIFYGLSEGIGSANQGYQTGTIRRLSTPNPINNGSGRNIMSR